LFRITKQLETENAVCGFSFLAYNSYFKPLVISILIDFEMLKIGILFLQYFFPLHNPSAALDYPVQPSNKKGWRRTATNPLLCVIRIIGKWQMQAYRWQI